MARTETQIALEEQAEEALYLLQQMQSAADDAPQTQRIKEDAPQPALQSATLMRYLTEKRQMLHWGSRLLLFAVFITVLLEVAVGFSIWPVSLSLAALYGTLALSFYRKTALKRKNTTQLLKEADMLLRHRWLSWLSIVSSGMVVVFMLLTSISVVPDLLVGDVSTALVSHFLLATMLACSALWGTVQQQRQIETLRRKRKRG